MPCSGYALRVKTASFVDQVGNRIPDEHFHAWKLARVQYRALPGTT
ncbi:MAG: hypothetical protein VKP72_02020 [bacterium]|jgi:hypothetical protein|nr:hypothetical protein [bacterium]